MSCQICYNAFDHSKHKPYFLSCPHTFCLECLDKLTDSKCPSCKKPIESRYPNLALLEFIPESSYDSIKQQAERILHETNDLKRVLARNYEQLLADNVNRVKSIRRNINASAIELINLVKLNQTKLLNQANQHEQTLLQQMERFKVDSRLDDKITYARVCLLKNNLNESEMFALKNDLSQVKLELIKLKTMSQLRYNYEFSKFKTINSETGVFGELSSNETEFEDLIKKGREYYTAGRFKESLECYERACELNPHSAQVYNFKAESFTALKEYKQAIECCDKSINLDKNNSVLYCNKGMVLSSLSEYNHAIDYFNKAIQLNPSYAIAFREKGIALRNLFKYSEAVECFDKALQIQPSDSVVFNLKGNVLGEIRHFKQAFECYSKCLQLDAKTSSVVFNNTCYNQLNESFRILNKAINSGLKTNELTRS